VICVYYVFTRGDEASYWLLEERAISWGIGYGYVCDMSVAYLRHVLDACVTWDAELHWLLKGPLQAADWGYGPLIDVYTPHVLE